MTEGIVLKSRNLFIDTETFLGKSFDFHHRDLLSVIKLVEQNLVRIYLCDITMMEVDKKIKEEISICMKRMRSAEMRVIRTIPTISQLFSIYNDEKMIEYIADGFRDFLNRAKVTIVPSDNIKLSTIFSQYCNSTGVFSSGDGKNRKHEFPDAMTLACIEDWCKEKGEVAYVVSGDSDWQQYCNQSVYLTYLPDLPVFLDAVIRNEDQFANLISFADQLLAYEWDQVIAKIKTGLSNVGFNLSPFNPLMLLDDHGILEAQILEKEITDVSREHARYTLTVLVTGLFKLKVFDNSVFAHELDDYPQMFLDHEDVYKLFDFKMDFELELGFEEGLTINTEVKDLYGPNWVDLETRKGKELDFDNWLSSLPVKVHGVNAGIITNDINDIEEFHDIAEARQLYPELDIWRGSKSFSRAVNELIQGPPLKFFSNYSMADSNNQK